MKIKFIVASTMVVVVTLALYFVPLPERIYVELPAVSYHDSIAEQSSTYTLSLKVWRLNYLFQKSKMTGRASLFSQSESILDEAKFTTSLFELGPLNTLGDVGYISISSYDKTENKYKVADIYIAMNTQEFVIKRDGSLFVAPADNQVEANKILGLFRDYVDFR